MTNLAIYGTTSPDKARKKKLLISLPEMNMSSEPTMSARAVYNSSYLICNTNRVMKEFVLRGCGHFDMSHLMIMDHLRVTVLGNLQSWTGRWLSFYELNVQKYVKFSIIFLFKPLMFCSIIRKSPKISTFLFFLNLGQLG